MQPSRVNAWVGQNVARIRNKRGWSQTDLAARLSAQLSRSIDPTTITRLERGTRPTSVKELAALAELFEQDMPDLLREPAAMDAIDAANSAARRVSLIHEAIATRCAELSDAVVALAEAVQKARDIDPAANLDAAEASLALTPETAVANALAKRKQVKPEGRTGSQISAFGVDHGPAGPPWSQ
jgi:transcriptional regulator with XRE-family HTH domain